MIDIETRVVECFSAVFPGLSREQIIVLDRGSAEAWDSLASITLMTVLQEELNLELDLADLEHLSSFQAVLDHVAMRIPSGTSEIH